MDEEEKPTSILERIVRWAMERDSATMIGLREEGGFNYSCAYYRGRMSAFQTVLDFIEWYDLDLRGSASKPGG